MNAEGYVRQVGGEWYVLGGKWEVSGMFLGGKEEIKEWKGDLLISYTLFVDI